MSETVRRPWSERIWFYPPGSWSPGWRLVQWGGGDEYDWHTLVVGSWPTGAIVLARKPCPRTGKCADVDAATIREWTPVPADPTETEPEEGQQ